MIKHNVNRIGQNPVNLKAVKSYLRVDEGDIGEDVIIPDLIENATIYAEKFTGKQANDKQTVTSTYKGVCYNHNTRNYSLPVPYINSEYAITSIKYTTRDETITVDSSDYYFDGFHIIVIRQFTEAGYFTVVSEATITESERDQFKTPLYKIIADAYMNREDQGIESLAIVERSADKYLHQLQNASQWI